MSGFDTAATAISLAKQYMNVCEGPPGDISLPKETLSIMLSEFIHLWNDQQDKIREGFKKAAQ